MTERRRAGLLAATAFAAPLLVFWPATRLPLLAWDDATNVTRNANLSFTAAGLSWMWTGSSLGHWHPLTWMSLALDRALWGGGAFGYHLTSVLLHALNGLLLFLLARPLLRPAAARARDVDLAALAAALAWSLHPLRVESVAWVSERRDVLCGALALSSALAWVRGARAGEGRAGGRWRWAALALGAAAMAAKVFAVVLPGVLLILDVRLRRPRPRRDLYLEKIPWLLPIGVALGFNLSAQAASGAAVSWADFGAKARLAQAAYGLAFYVAKTLWPSGLSPLYERSLLLEPAPFLAGALVCAAAAVLVWTQRRSRPALAHAALAYVLLALPALGLFKSGRMTAADRYSYLPALPLALLAGAALAQALAKPAVRGLALAALAALAAATRRQLPVWSSDEALWTRACAGSPLSYFARQQLAAAYEARGDAAGAAVEWARAERLHRQVFADAAEAYAARGDQALAAEARRRAEKGLEISREAALAGGRRRRSRGRPRVHRLLPVLGNGFVNWDDYTFLLHNPNVQGLDWARLKWMFTTAYSTTYEPLGWLLYGAVYSWRGYDPAAYHLASLVLHAFNAAVLYWIIYRLLEISAPGKTETLRSGRVLSAVLAALLWALHPLQVEPVAWTTALFSLLATTFFLASLLAYLRYAEKLERRGWLVLSWILFAASGLSRWKGMSLPIVLVILDIYPLGRLDADPRKWLRPSRRRALLEKIPFALLTAAIALVTAISRGQLARYHFVFRPQDIGIRLLLPLWKSLYPAGLIPIYSLEAVPGPLGWPGFALGVVAAATVVFFLLRRRFPGGLGAWIFYLAAMLPTTLYVPGGTPFAYLHYAYLACLGFAALLGGGLMACWRLSKRTRLFLAPFGLAAVLLILLARQSRRQIPVWRDSISLWTHALAVDPRALVAHPELATALLDLNLADEAADHLRQHLLLHPEDQVVRKYLAWLLPRLPGLRAENARAHAERGDALRQEGRFEEAETEFTKALSLDPRLADAHSGLGLLLYRRGRRGDAVRP